LIFKESLLHIADNSGAKRVLCIKVLNKPIGYPGVILISAIKYAIPKKFRNKKKVIKKGEIHKVLLASTKRFIFRKTGYFLKGPLNLGIILRKDNLSLPFGNRIKHPLFLNIRKVSSRIASIAPNIY
jgi:large subunit ribosomal protein L14